MDGILAETMHILVVDDDDVDRERVARFVRQSSLKAEPTEAASAKEAIALLDTRDFDCVVLDHELRDGSGAELLPRLRGTAAHQRPVIMVTGAGDEELAAEVMRAGAADYLPKHKLSSDVLDRAISRSLETGRLQEQLRAVADALAASEAKYRAMVEDQVELVSLSRPDLTLTFANAAFALHHGVDRAQIAGSCLLDYVAADDRESVRAHLEAIGRNKAPKRVECRSMSAVANVTRWVAWTHLALHDAQGNVASIQSVGRDVTDQVQGREAVARLAAIVDSSADAIVSTDLHGTITTWNHAAEHLFGHRVRDALGKSIDMIVPADRVVEESILAQRVRGGESIVEFQTVRMRRNAICVDVAITHSPIRDGQGNVIGVSKIIRDISERKRLERALRDSERQFRELYEETPAMLHSVDAKGRLLSVSDTWLSELGYLRNEVVGQPFLNFLTADSRKRVQDSLLPQLLTSGRCDELPCQVRRSDGAVMEVLMSARLERDFAGNPGRALAVLKDVTEQNRLARALDEEYARLRVTLRSIGDAVITTDREGRVEFLNPVAENLTGWTLDDARGKPIEQVFNVVNEESHRAVDNPVTLSLQEERPVGLPERSVLIARDGNEFGIEDSTAPIRDLQGNSLGAVVVFHDVTAQRRMALELNFRARHDPLTGLVNRTEFSDRLTRTLNRVKDGARDMTLLYLDLDQFKLVNDACGHAVGDQLLRQIGGALQRCIRDRDTLARLGGDEFGVILEHCPAEQAHRVAQQICERIEEFRFVHDQRRFRLGVSIGLVSIDAHWPNEASLLQAADSCCYAAKEAGRNRVHAWLDTDAILRNHNGEAHWASRIENALDEDRFVLYAQSIVPLASPAAGVHCEILLRMIDEDGSLILPGIILPAAERFHMTPRIDRWVLRRVIEWMSSAPELLAGVDMIAVNLSGQSLGDRAFHRFVSDLLGQKPCDVGKLCLEVTETSAITRLHDAAEFVSRMRGLGVRVALDDFGAGASSFGYLKSLPVDLLKIDGQFIRNIIDDPLDDVAVRSFRNVAAVLGIKTVAEFVENAQIRDRLIEIGIDYGQGYAFHVPEPLDDFFGNRRAAAASAAHAGPAR
jgi:diguanylate cyclase (GGDEF)-like protein/PAS domain S-box-containing protein